VFKVLQVYRVPEVKDTKILTTYSLIACSATKLV